jgi:hypothetical protein
MTDERKEKSGVCESLFETRYNKKTLRPRSALLISRLKNTVGLFVTREKHYSC